MKYRGVTLLLAWVFLAACGPLRPDPQAPDPQRLEPAAEAGQVEAAVLLVASEATGGAFVEVACAGTSAREQCLDTIPLGEDLALLGGGGAAIAGPTTLDLPTCGGVLPALEMVQPGQGWAVWPVAIPLTAPSDVGVSMEARHADKADIARALVSQDDPPSASVTKLVAAKDLDGDGLDDRVYRLGPDGSTDTEARALAVLTTAEPARISFIEGEEGGTIVLQGLVDLDGDGAYELLVSERWPAGFEHLVVSVAGPEVEVYGAWGCTLAPAPSPAPAVLPAVEPIEDAAGTP